MKIVITTDKYEVQIDDIDADKIAKYNWSTFHPSRGKHRYAKAWVNDEKGRRVVSMHRYLMEEPVGLYVDHVDGNGLNNQRNNLRFATNQLNQANSRKKVPGSSKYKGVHYSKARQKWRSQIMFNGKYIHLGYFLTEDEAGQAYNAAAKKHFGDYAYLNKI